jgi:hypothetical protein
MGTAERMPTGLAVPLGAIEDSTLGGLDGRMDDPAPSGDSVDTAVAQATVTIEISPTRACRKHLTPVAMD